MNKSYISDNRTFNISSMLLYNSVFTKGVEISLFCCESEIDVFSQCQSITFLLLLTTGLA